MYILRARFEGGIVTEFLPPSRKSNRVIIFCGGMPSLPSNKKLLEFFSRKGYWAFQPRYRGSWESGGTFLKISPDKDILAVISQLPKGFKDLWSGKTYKVSPGAIYLFAGSFGGAAGIIASLDPRITKVVALSPVVDWQAPSKAEPLDWLYGFVKQAFGKAYRMRKSDWKKLAGGKFYNPVRYVDKIDGSKLLIIHAKDDESVGFREVRLFAKRVGCGFIALKKGGHLSVSLLVKPRFYKIVRKFLKNK